MAGQLRVSRHARGARAGERRHRRSAPGRNGVAGLPRRPLRPGCRGAPPMSRAVARVLAVPLVVLVVWAVLAIVAPIAMAQYPQYSPRAGISCQPVVILSRASTLLPASCGSLAEAYHLGFLDLLVDATLRSLTLLVGAAVLALVVGTLLGVAIALQRRRAFAGGALMGATSLVAAVPSFFVAYFLQIVVIVIGAG